MAAKDSLAVTFHAGVLTIGGTIVEVAYKDAHLFFDFGTEFRPELDLPDESLRTLLDNRLVPELRGLYDPRLGYHYAGDETRDYAHTAVFISHVHLDHTRMLNYLDPAVPLYALAASKAILPVLNKNGDFLLPSPYEAANFTREVIGLAPYDTVELGEMSVEICPVDHDAYGAAGLIIRAGGKKLVYTGDLRLHGFDAADTLAFCEKAADCDALIMEGVSISFPEREADPEAPVIHSESDLLGEMQRQIRTHPHRQLTFNGYPANLKRFSQLARQIRGRKVVLTAEMAALLLAVLGQEVAYYYPTGAAREPALDPRLAVDFDRLLRDEDLYFWQAVGDFDKMKSGGLYIHSDATPLGDFDPAYAKFLALLDAQGIEFLRLACSGHAVPADLDRIISLIRPQLLLPIHSYHPEKLENPYGSRILPDRGQKINL